MIVTDDVKRAAELIWQLANIYDWLVVTDVKLRIQ